MARPLLLRVRLLHHVLLDAVRDPEGYAEAAPHVAVGPVHHPTADKFGVRNQDIDVVVGDNRCRPDLNVAHFAVDAGFEFDKITDLQRLIEQQHNPRDEVTEQCFQPETETDPNGAAQHCEVTQRYPEHRDRQEEADHQNGVGDQPRQGVPRRDMAALLPTRAAHNNHAQHERDQAGSEENSYCGQRLVQCDRCTERADRGTGSVAVHALSKSQQACMTGGRAAMGREAFQLYPEARLCQ